MLEEWQGSRLLTVCPCRCIDRPWVEIINFKQLESTMFACKWTVLRNNWWSWSASPKITFKEKIDTKWMTLLLGLLDYTCPLQRRRSQTDGHQGGGTSQELCSPWRIWVTSSEQCFGFVCYRLAPVVLAIVPDPRFFSFFKVNDGSVVAKEESAALLVD